MAKVLDDPELHRRCGGSIWPTVDSSRQPRKRTTRQVCLALRTLRKRPALHRAHLPLRPRGEDQLAEWTVLVYGADARVVALNIHSIALNVRVVALNIHIIALNVHIIAFNVRVVALNIHSITVRASFLAPANVRGGVANSPGGRGVSKGLTAAWSPSPHLLAQKLLALLSLLPQLACPLARLAPARVPLNDDGLLDAQLQVCKPSAATVTQSVSPIAGGEAVYTQRENQSEEGREDPVRESSASGERIVQWESGLICREWDKWDKWDKWLDAEGD
eukprot:1182141-Prorocentrum_minimum.AAC.1